jgi:phosphoribulokinase
MPAGTDLLFYEGLHGGYIDEERNVADRGDLKSLRRQRHTKCR